MEKLLNMIHQRIYYKKQQDSLVSYIENQQYKEMMQHPTFHFFTKDDLSEQTLNRWFGKGIAKTRRDVLKTEVQNIESVDNS